MSKKSHAPLPVFKAICDEQDEAYDLCASSTITFLSGTAGCTKTYTAMAYAIDQLLDTNSRIDKIVLTRPAIEACGEQIGFTPGSINQKMAPFVHPLMEKIDEYAPNHKDIVKGSCEIVPLAYMRGRTLRNCVAILDEAQNATERQLEMFMTRIGRGTTLIICGDPGQADIRDNPLMSVARDMCEKRGISHFQFSTAASVARHPLIPHILEVFEARRK